MKKYILTACVLSFLFSFLNTAKAQEPSSEATSSSYIAYDLSFPGTLPDNPFYKLKILRDKILLQFTLNGEKKIDFYLRLADKGILAAAILIDKHNIPLSQQTALKAEHNMTLLVNELHGLPYQPQSSLIEKLKTASLKHQEVLSFLLPRVSENDRKTFQTVIDFSKRNLQTIQDYRYEK